MYKKIIFGLLSAALLTVLFAACTIRDASTLPSGPTVHMGGSQFLQTTITLKKGDKLTLVDDAAAPHVITNGKWDGATQKPALEPGAPRVNLNFSGGDSKSTDPFNTAGTFAIYCTIHGGMNLTVTVQ